MTKKTLSAISLFVLMLVAGFAQDLEGRSFMLKAGPGFYDSTMRIQFQNNNVLIPELDDVVREAQGGNKFRPYRLVNENNIPFLLVPERGQKFVILTDGEYLLLYDQDNKRVYEAGDPSPGRNLEMLRAEYRTSSFLEEKLASGTISYPAKNLGDYSQLEKPWVNAGNKYGIGEKITVSFPEPISRLWISNGYVSATRPQYYAFNSRVNKLRITDLAGNEGFTFTLSDTPDIQYCDLAVPATKVEIMILDVYPGTKYKDTCINFILGERHEEVNLGPQGMDVMPPGER